MKASMTPRKLTRDQKHMMKLLGIALPVDEEKEDAALRQAQRKWDLSKFSTQELKDELESRGYVNGVLMYPELDNDDE